MPQRVDVAASSKHGPESCSLLWGKTCYFNDVFRLVVVYVQVEMRYIEVAAVHHRLLPLEALQIGPHLGFPEIARSRMEPDRKRLGD